jgi:hypothetical protein
MAGKPRKKAIEQAKLKATDTIWIGLKMTEGNFQRLAALLLFAEIDFKVDAEAVPTGPLPWENPADPAFNKPPELEIDFETVRRGIAKHLLAMNEKGRLEEAKQLLAEFKATGLSSIPQDRLVVFHDTLEAML